MDRNDDNYTDGTSKLSGRGLQSPLEVRLTSKGGMPAYKLLLPNIGHVYMSDDWYRSLYEMEDGEVVMSEEVIDDLHQQLPDLTFGEAIVHRIGRFKKAIEPDFSNPYRVLIPINTNVDCTLYITRTLMDLRRLCVDEPWFVNGYHRITLLDHNVKGEHIVLQLTCDESLREFL